MGGRDRIVVSGYYGFDNLGDEAILEELLSELKRLVEPEKIVVLSQNPEKTTAVFDVASVNRWRLGKIASLLLGAKLFVSGGGGLYQDASSVRSVVYYSTLAILARLSGAETVIYAQGVGPLKSQTSTVLTRLAMKQATAISVRDLDSKALLESWGLKPQLTADPVWCLKPSALPPALSVFEEREKKARGNINEERLLVGLSLRESQLVSRATIELLAEVMADRMPNVTIVPLALQAEQDVERLDQFLLVWAKRGLPILKKSDLSTLLRPSQWLSLIGKFDLLVGMRFHALLMALKSGVPCFGIAYDPKVSYLMRNFEQPCLNIANSSQPDELRIEIENLVSDLIGNIDSLALKARRKSDETERLACQNFDILARILNNRSERT